MSGRSKKLLLAATFLVVGLVALLCWKAASQAEPVYQGRPLTSWVEQWYSNRWVVVVFTDETKKAAQEAEDAIHQTGKDGIQFLLSLMKAREPAIKPWLRNKVPTSWHSRLHLEDTVERSKHLGSGGLAALGTNAGPAVSGLIELLSLEMNRNPPDQNNAHRTVFTLSYLGSAADPAVPMLVQCLTNRPPLHHMAARGLGQLCRKPEIVVPALLDYLKGEESDDASTIRLIGAFGTNAFAAAPTLVALLDDPNPDTRRAATNWLPAIDPATAERAGILPIRRER